MTKDQRQEISLDNWQDAGYQGTVVATTGFGKTVIAIKAIPRIKPKTVRILIPRVHLFKQWKETIDNWLAAYTDPIDIKIWTVQECVENRYTDDVDLLIVDELHMFFTSTSIRTLGFSSYIDGSKIKAKARLGLTATYRLKNNAHKMWENIWPIVDQITRREARENGWVSEFVTYNLMIELTNENQIKYNELTEEIGKYIGKFERKTQPNGYRLASFLVHGGTSDINRQWYPGYKWAISVAKELGYDGSKDHEYSPDKLMGYAKRLMESTRERKELLEISNEKIEVVLDLLLQCRPEKTIVFSESTKLPDIIEREIQKLIPREEVVKYHSNMESVPLRDETGEFITYKSGAKRGQVKLFGKDSLKKYALEAIKNDPKVWLLLSAKALDTGLDAPNLKYGIVTSGSFKPEQQTQRTGRVIRIQHPDDECYVINVAFKNTIEYARLKATIGDDETVIWVEDVNSIFNEEILTI